MSDLDRIRAQKDRFFKISPDSPIPYDERASFEGLRYYPENEGLRLEVWIEEFATKEPIQMLTSTGGVQEYLRWGRFPVEAEGRSADLTAYYAQWGGYFVPFVDATSGDETAPGSGPCAVGAHTVERNIANSCPYPAERTSLAEGVALPELWAARAAGAADSAAEPGTASRSSEQHHA